MDGIHAFLNQDATAGQYRNELTHSGLQHEKGHQTNGNCGSNGSNGGLGAIYLCFCLSICVSIWIKQKHINEVLVQIKIYSEGVPNISLYFSFLHNLDPKKTFRILEQRVFFFNIGYFATRL